MKIVAFICALLTLSSLLLGAGLSGVSQEMAPPAVRVDILAPANALLNDVISVKMVEGNNPVVGGTILVVSPTKESMVLLTDSNGEAEFNATYEGVYTYSAPGHYLVSISVTNVVKPAKPVTTFSTPAPEQPPQQQAPPSVAMVLSTYAPWVLGMLVLLLIAFLLATPRKKKKGNKAVNYKLSLYLIHYI